MRTKGREQVSGFTPDNLIAGNRHPVDYCHVVIKAGQKLERGSVLEEDAEEAGKYILLSGAAAETGSKAEYILAEDVDATETDTVGLVYRTGEFAENELIVGEGYEITDKDRKALRNAGILLSTIMK